MAKKALELVIATTFLSPERLPVTRKIVDAMMETAMSDKDADLSESLGRIRGDLRKLAEQKGGS